VKIEVNDFMSQPNFTESISVHPNIFYSIKEIAALRGLSFCMEEMVITKNIKKPVHKNE